MCLCNGSSCLNSEILCESLNIQEMDSTHKSNIDGNTAFKKCVYVGLGIIVIVIVTLSFKH